MKVNAYTRLNAVRKITAADDMKIYRALWNVADSYGYNEDAEIAFSGACTFCYMMFGWQTAADSLALLLINAGLNDDIIDLYNDTSEVSFEEYREDVISFIRRENTPNKKLRVYLEGLTEFDGKPEKYIYQKLYEDFLKRTS